MVEEEPDAREEWAGLKPVERIEKVVERRIFFRCPICLAHLTEVTDCHPGQRGMMWDCGKCSIRLRLWQYNPGGAR